MVNQLVDFAAKALGRLAENAEQDYTRRLDGAALLRSYFIELAANLDLLDCLEDSALKSVQPGSPAFAALAVRLETRIAEVILTEGEAARPGGLYEVLRQTGGAEAQKGAVYANVLEAVAFTLTKITVLKKLSSLTGEESALLHGIDLSKRIGNLKKRLLSIKATLRGLGGVTGIPPADE
jgi:hypothetical protein